MRAASTPRPASAPRRAPAAAGQEFSPIPDVVLDQIKERANVVEVVSRRVSLKKAGSAMVGLCPFHTEKSPSFTVSASRNTYHCFGCGAHGNALGFLMEHDGLPFRQAVSELAQELGIALPRQLLNGGGQRAADTAAHYQAMEMAQRFFAHCLRHTSQARTYLGTARRLDPRMLKRFAIGYAPAQWRGLREAFPDYDRNAVIVQAGLVREKVEEKPKETSSVPACETAAAARSNRYDTFRDRITFGVRDSRGRIVAFGGRALGAAPQSASEPQAAGATPATTPTAPKYLNSPESPIFDKSSTLFGLYEARESIRQSKQALVVEGYLDVVMLAQHGIENVVAAMGTAFTRWHLERLLTQTSRVVFCFDGDAAGQAAAFKAMQTCAGLIEDEHDFRFVIFPDGMDPDEFVQARGAQAVRDLVQAAPGWTEFMIKSVQARHGISTSATSTAEGKRSASFTSAEARARFAAEAAAIAQRISYRTRLRSIVMQHIAAESKLPGASVQALRSMQQSVTSRDLWQLLVDSARLAPATAVQVRQEVLDLLEPADEREAALVGVLQSLDASAADAVQAAGYLMARDSLRGAVDLILSHRQRQVRDELNRQLQAGQITDHEFLLAKQALEVAPAAEASMG